MVNNGNMTGTGTWGVDIDNYGTISAGTYTALVTNYSGATITGGNFTGTLQNEGGSVSGAYLNGTIVNNSGTISGCTFGPNANITSNSGTIELTASVDGSNRTVNYGANILSTLGTGTWYIVSGDDYTPVDGDDTFA